MTFMGRLCQIGRHLNEYLIQSSCQNMVKLDFGVYIEFKNFNKAYPMHPYPLPWNNDLVDKSSGFQRCFYWIHFQDTTKFLCMGLTTSILLSLQIICQRVTLFSLKKPQYLKMMNTMFEGDLVRRVEVQIDDIVVKHKNVRIICKIYKKSLISSKGTTFRKHFH